MKFWGVVYILGKVVATFGPLPVDHDKCVQTAIDQAGEWDENWTKKDLDHAPQMVVDGYRLKRSDITTACITADHRPALGSFQ